MRGKTRLLLFGVAALVVLVTAGCQKKLTYERWESLRVGQDVKVVKSTIGKPLDDRNGRMIYTDQDRGIAVHVFLDPQGKRLIYTEWTDPAHGTRAIGNPPTPNR